MVGEGCGVRVISMSIERLSIVEDEGDENIFHMEEAEEGQANLDLCYVGYFLMDHLIRTNIMKERMEIIWRPG